MNKVFHIIKISLMISLVSQALVSFASDRTSTTVSATVQPYMSVTQVTPAPSFIITPVSAQQAQYFDSSWTVTSNAPNQQYLVTTIVDNADNQGPYMSLQNPPPGTLDPLLSRVHYIIYYYPCGTAAGNPAALTGSGSSNGGSATFISNITDPQYGIFTVCSGSQTGDLRFILYNTAVNPYPISGSYLGQVTLIASPYN